MRTRISANWLMATVSPNIVTAPRTYLTFEILRDGTVTNVQITQSSGIPEVDRSALRAILASNPLPPLPSDYSGEASMCSFILTFIASRRQTMSGGAGPVGPEIYHTVRHRFSSLQAS